MKLIPNKAAVRLSRGLLLAKKNSPHILFGLGIAGGVTAAVLASKATLDIQPEYKALKDRLQDNKDHTFETEQEKAVHLGQVYGLFGKEVAKTYGPAVVVGALSIASLAGSHKIMTGRNAALAAAYASLDKAYNEYRSAIEEKFGEQADREAAYGVDKWKEKDEKTGKAKEVKGPREISNHARFFDQLNNNWDPRVEYNRLWLGAQQKWMNDLLTARGHVFLNEVYDALGMERSKAGAVVGWVLAEGNNNYIDFGVFDGRDSTRDFVNGREAAVLLDFNVDGIIYDLI